MRSLILLGLLLWLAVAGFAQKTLFTVHATTRDITCIFPVDDMTYIGTTGGLLTSQNGDVRHSLPGIAVYSLLQTVDQVLAATTHGVFRIIPDGVSEKIIPGPSTALLQSDAGLWVGRPAGKLERFTSDDFAAAVETINLPSSSPVFHIAQFHGEIFASTIDGIWRLDATGPVRQVLSQNLLSNSIICLYATGTTLYAGTPDGLFEYARGDWLRVEVPKLAHGFIYDLTIAHDGALLVATGEAGVIRLKGNMEEPVAGVPLEVQTLAVDSTNRLLMGTSDEGAWWVPLDISVTRATRLTQHGNEIPQNALTGVSAENGRVIIGTATRGIAVLRNNRWQTIDTTNGLTSDWVNQVALNNGKVFVRFSDGTVATQLPQGNWRKIDKHPDGWPKDWTSALGTDRGALWAGTQNAFYLQDPKGWKIFAPKPQLQNVMVLDLAGQGGDIWLATHKHGIFRWHPKRNIWHNWSLKDDFPDTWVQAIEVVGNRIYAGTFSNGLCVFENDRWRTIWPDTAIAGPDARINCLASAGEILFAGTLKGLLVVTPQGHRLFTLTDGLPDDSIRGLAVDEGTLWGATDSGLFNVNFKDLEDSY